MIDLSRHKTIFKTFLNIKMDYGYWPQNHTIS